MPRTPETTRTSGVTRTPDTANTPEPHAGRLLLVAAALRGAVAGAVRALVAWVLEQHAR